MAQIQCVRMNCDAIAPYYSVLEQLSFGGFLVQSRFAFLEEAKASHRAILCGGGDGRFLARLLRENLHVQVDFVDLSPKMVELAERRVARMGAAFRERVEFYACDVREFAAHHDKYDLIVTHFFLDCLSAEELSSVVSRLANWGTPDARWIVSEFGEAEGPVGRLWTRAVIRLLYAAFRFATGLQVTRLPHYQAALAREGYLMCCQKTALRGLLQSSLWTV